MGSVGKGCGDPRLSVRRLDIPQAPLKLGFSHPLLSLLPSPFRAEQGWPRGSEDFPGLDQGQEGVVNRTALCMAGSSGRAKGGMGDLLWNPRGQGEESSPGVTSDSPR